MLGTQDEVMEMIGLWKWQEVQYNSGQQWEKEDKELNWGIGNLEM